MDYGWLIIIEIRVIFTILLIFIVWYLEMRNWTSIQWWMSLWLSDSHERFISSESNNQIYALKYIESVLIDIIICSMFLFHDVDLDWCVFPPKLQFYDLLNIFKLNGLPSEENPYLFNGDFVDRGSFSLEVILTLFAFKCMSPSGKTFSLNWLFNTVWL